MRFASFDFFRKINTDVGETSSALGGLLTILAFTLVTILTMNEVKLHFQAEIDSYTVIDNDSKQFLYVHLDLIVSAPCAVVSLDQQDQVGIHILDVGDTLQKIRLDSKRRALPPHAPRDSSDQSNHDHVAEIMEAINLGEQCQLLGYFRINKVPGNFHVSYHAYYTIIQQIYQRDIGTFKNLRLDHSINDLHFGDYSDISKTLQKYPKSFQKYMRPNEKWVSITKKSPAESKQDYEYHLDALPARVYDPQTQQLKIYYKYSISEVSMTKTATEMDSIYFRYQLSPVNMVYKFKEKSVYHFTVQLLAIVGGVFAVIGILNSILQKLI